MLNKDLTNFHDNNNMKIKKKLLTVEKKKPAREFQMHA